MAVLASLRLAIATVSDVPIAEGTGLGFLCVTALMSLCMHLFLLGV